MRTENATMFLSPGTVEICLQTLADGRTRNGQCHPSGAIAWGTDFWPVKPWCRRWYRVSRLGGVVLCDRDEPAQFNSRVHQTPIASFVRR